MKVAQLRLIQSVYDTFPMLLLDDTFAELDLTNKKILMKILEKHTCIVYTTVVKEDLELCCDGAQYYMKNGKLING